MGPNLCPISGCDWASTFNTDGVCYDAFRRCSRCIDPLTTSRPAPCSCSLLLLQHFLRGEGSCGGPGRGRFLLKFKISSFSNLVEDGLSYFAKISTFSNLEDDGISDFAKISTFSNLEDDGNSNFPIMLE